METFVTVVHIVTCVLLVLVVLIQSGKGAEISTTLGGSSQTIFGSSGGANFFTRFTAAMAAIFMLTSITLTIMQSESRTSIFDTQRHNPANPTAPMTPGAGADQQNSAPAPAAPEAAPNAPQPAAPAQ